MNVIASAAGTIKALRDGVSDIAHTPARASELDGKECENGVVIAHDQGWETQYCHLKQGSISVKVVGTVQVGDVLGKTSLSGQTRFHTFMFLCAIRELVLIHLRHQGD